MIWQNYRYYKGRNCVICGSKLYGNGNNLKFCSRACRSVQDKKRRLERARIHRQLFKSCIVCANPIEQEIHGKIKMYCSNACKQKKYRRRSSKSNAVWNVYAKWLRSSYYIDLVRNIETHIYNGWKTANLSNSLKDMCVGTVFIGFSDLKIC